MTAPFTPGYGWFQYDPAKNAPLTPAELDLFNRLQTGDPVLRAQYEQKYGPVTPSIGTDGWYAAWTQDQDYWNVRYLNQRATPEEIARIQQSVAGAPYPYSLHTLNSLRQMQKEGTLDAYLKGFKDKGYADYLAAQLGKASGPSGPQPTGPPTPTFTPTQTGEGPPAGGPPPTPYGPIPPGPSTPSGGTSTVPSGGPHATTITPTNGPIAGPSLGNVLGNIPVWAWALVAVGAVLLFVRRSQ